MTNSSEPHFHDVRPCGDTGITVIVGQTVDQVTRSRVQALARTIDRAALPGVVETVPSYLSVLIHYDPLTTDFSSIVGALGSLPLTEGEEGGIRNWTLPICFDGPDFAPDLMAVADWAGLSCEDVMQDILGTTQTIYMLGFAPGQPYMGDLPDRIAIPRRESPVPGIPTGAVLIATGKTVIYPSPNPTGWYVIGRTPVRIFDAAAADPVLLSPGDRVTFEPVDAETFRALEDALASGATDPRQGMCR